MSSAQEKSVLLDHLKRVCREKITLLEVDIASAQDSRNTASKSTAGDKHETGRAMMQIELDNLEKQLQTNSALAKELDRIVIDRHYDEVEFGAMVITDMGKYFISIGAGVVTLQDDKYFVISLASPVGQELNGKKVGDTIVFNQRTIAIEAII